MSFFVLWERWGINSCFSRNILLIYITDYLCFSEVSAQNGVEFLTGLAKHIVGRNKHLTFTSAHCTKLFFFHTHFNHIMSVTVWIYNRQSDIWNHLSLFINFLPIILKQACNFFWIVPLINSVSESLFSFVTAVIKVVPINCKTIPLFIYIVLPTHYSLL